jgi:hypothetical protein
MRLLAWFLLLVGMYLFLPPEGMPFAKAQTDLSGIIDSRELSIRATRVPNGSVAIDGILDEEFWAATAPATDFRQTEPIDGEL